MNPNRAGAQAPPELVYPEQGDLVKQRLGLEAEDRALLARAIQFTRVSYFTPMERERLAQLVTRVTGYVIRGGI